MSHVKAANLLLPLLCSLPVLAAAQTGASAETPDEIIVTGRQPGPPMWRVINGENVLWIFPQLTPVPKDMIWESDKAAAVIARAQEVLQLPNIGVDVSTRVYLNPVNLFRGMRLAKRLSRDPAGRTLEEALPPALYARFLALEAKYFPNDSEELEELRPAFAAERMVGSVQSKEGLGGDGDIMKTLQRLIRRNRDAERTEIEVKVDLEGGFGELAKRAEGLTASLDPALELECFESQLSRMENDVDEMRRRANSWARGYIDDFRGAPLPGSDEDSCLALIVSSSERDVFVDTRAKLDTLWLENAERALHAHRTTFAILPIGDLLRSEGPIAKLKAKGYEVREP
ncbi:MAG TPA: TraB/GumN family protein [Gammaproteobacteria bacterium]|nr:TraB/GumN family protein [Gammaproteobacteria bacterium]